MSSHNGPFGQPSRIQQRPHYVPSSDAQPSNSSKLVHSPTHSLPSSIGPSPQNGSTSSSTPNTRSVGKMRENHGISSPAASRLSQFSPSAYDRFDELSWIVDLSSRIGNALRTPPRSSVQASAIASPSPSSSQVHVQRHRVRLPRPSKEFRDLQHKVQLNHASTSTSAAPDTSTNLAKSVNADSTDSAIQWAQHAQQDFERRRTDLQRSRQSVLKHFEDDQQEHDSETPAEPTVDPAVERSMLAARSLQELMRSGGLQSEQGDEEQLGFADLLANAEPLPGGAQLGPSSLFEANRGSDGTLDIESILQQRAKMAAIDESKQSAPSTSRRSMLDLSQSAPKPTKRPVIEILGTGEPPSAPNSQDQLDHDEDQVVQRATDKVSQSSDDSSSQSSSESEDSSSSEDSDSDSDLDADAAASGDRGELEARSTVPAQTTIQHSTTPHPMHQMVDGAFQIIPARYGQTLSQQQSFFQHQDEAEESSAQEDSDRGGQQADDDDEQIDSESDVEASDGDDEEDEMEETDEHGYAAASARHRYHDGFRGMDTRNLLFDGPAGDADEPIVLSDSDDDAGPGDEEDDKEQGQDDEMEENSQDVLAEESQDEESDQEESEAGEADNVEAAREAIVQIQPHTSLDNHAEGLTDTRADSDRLAQQLRTQSTSAMDQMITDVQQVNGSSTHLLDSHTSDQGGDAMSDSEVEPEELDEELRWSDLEANQSADQESPYAQGTASASADAAFRAIHGSQPMPGFVTASQLFADIEAAGANAADRTGPSASDADLSTGPIDPQLLASYVNNQQGPDASDSYRDTSASAIATGPAQPEPSVPQTESDIFDAFMRQDASSSAREQAADDLVEDTSFLQADPKDGHEDAEVSADASGVVTVPQARQPDEETKDLLSAGHIGLSQQSEASEEVLPEKEPSSNVQETRSLSIPVITPEESRKPPEDPQSFNLTETPVTTIAEPIKPAARDEIADPAMDSQAEEAQVTAASLSDADDDVDESIEPIKPVLARIESIDVLEADVEDNSEDDAANEEIVIKLGGAPDPAAPVAPAESRSKVLAAEPANISGSAPNADEISEADRPATSGTSQPLISIDVHEEEAILSGDLADRDSSIERQAPTEAGKTFEVARESEAERKDETVAEDRNSDLELASSSGPHDEQKETQESALKDDDLAGKRETEDGKEVKDEEEAKGEVEMKKKEVKVGEESRDGAANGQVDQQSARREAKEGSEVASIEPEQSTASESKDPSKDVEAPSSAGLNSLFPIRVPPSPASSDRRSTSSFTPSANRQGNRHIHGAAKRNLFAQMTEAASSLASNLAAPLRAIPSLLPISESQADEKSEDDDVAEATTTADDHAPRNGQAEAQQQQKRSSKSVEATEYTITTRAHCICRKLQLNKIEGAPVFIVPGCSINYEKARLEDAEDLGKTSEQKANDWIDVDPDFLPPDVHHMLSRIIGLQMLNEGICVEPESSAAKLLFAGYDLDADLTMSVDDDKERDVKLLEANFEAKKQPNADDNVEAEGLDIEAKAEEPDSNAKAKEQEADINAKADADEDIDAEELESPSRTRHRRAVSVASASSHHRSPRRSNPMSANADYLPDEERKTLQKGRHPPAVAPGDISIASLEEQLEEDEEDGADTDSRILPAGKGENEGTDGSDDPAVTNASHPKRKRGRPRKSATADASFKPSAQDEKEADEEDAQPVAESKTKKGRGRKRAASSEEKSTEAQASDAKDAQDAAAVEDVLDSVAPKLKKARRGRQSEETTAFDPREDQSNGEDEEDDEGEKGSSGHTPATRKDEGETQQQKEGELVEEETRHSEWKENDKVKRGGRGGRKRKQAADDSSSAAEASAAGKVAKTEEVESAKQPRRSRRSQVGAQSQNSSPGKTSPRKSRKVLKLN
ncbi:uncharacterized protein UTRI_00793 [Ustilago trichophora]|uniref:Uncharacterized protein n=1 Tax=Ustilago trichophora TaxID=86804 RepID=A0A5C3DVX4_9BASI|nr:uncharacterized protein UTRI_00793 [Ustilago trichophora]